MSCRSFKPKAFSTAGSFSVMTAIQSLTASRMRPFAIGAGSDMSDDSRFAQLLDRRVGQAEYVVVDSSVVFADMRRELRRHLVGAVDAQRAVAEYDRAV